MAKVLYGQVQKRADFDKIIRLKGTQTRIGQAGKEFFLLDTFYRVIGIYKSYEKAKDSYRPTADRYLHLTLEQIKRHNKGRCTDAVCRQIFEAVKAGDHDRYDVGDTFTYNGVKYKVKQVRTVFYYAQDPTGMVYRIRIANVT